MGWLKRARHRIGEASGDQPLDSLRYVVVDTELTSLEARTNRLLSIGAISMQGPSIRLGEQFYRVVNPQVSIPAETVVIHKLRSEDVQQGDQLQATLKDFSQLAEGAVLVGHFVNIDLKVLHKESAQVGLKLDNPAIDTALVHHWILRHGPYSEDLSLQLEKLNLPTLAKFYSIDVDNSHHALSDAFLTARVWQKMLYTLQARGIDKLDKLLRVGGA